MKQKNYNESVSKWTNIIEVLKRTPDGTCAELYIIDPCGFCKQFAPEIETCGKCPLQQEYCSNVPDDTKIFWQIARALTNDENKKALELAEKMLTKIKRYAPASLGKQNIKETEK